MHETDGGNGADVTGSIQLDLASARPLMPAPPRPGRIAFYAPMKPPDHPVASGDRLMARQFIAALTAGGHTVAVASTLRIYLRAPDDGDAAHMLRAQATAETARIDAQWSASGPPDLWFCYHPYYKSPDLIGPELCRRFGVPYVTAESSFSARRDLGQWAGAQADVLNGAKQAALNICLTRRDQQGLTEASPEAETAYLRPFIDTAPFLHLAPTPEPGRLITVAMMRPGDKMESYAMLARALSRISDLAWRISIIGDGSERAAVKALFAPVADRVDWLGVLSTDAVAAHLSRAMLYLWPGCGEAYGLAYLEAQAAGLPVIAQDIAGVPEVVDDGVTGLLTPPGDVDAYAAAIRHLLTQSKARETLAMQTRNHVTNHHSAAAAAVRLAALLAPILDQRT